MPESVLAALENNHTDPAVPEADICYARALADPNLAVRFLAREVRRLNAELDKAKREYDFQLRYGPR